MVQILLKAGCDLDVQDDVSRSRHSVGGWPSAGLVCMESHRVTSCEVGEGQHFLAPPWWEELPLEALLWDLFSVAGVVWFSHHSSCRVLVFPI